jgi:hypothetical protein
MYPLESVHLTIPDFFPEFFIMSLHHSAKRIRALLPLSWAVVSAFLFAEFERE